MKYNDVDYEKQLYSGVVFLCFKSKNTCGNFKYNLNCNDGKMEEKSIFKCQFYYHNEM